MLYDVITDGAVEVVHADHGRVGAEQVAEARFAGAETPFPFPRSHLEHRHPLEKAIPRGEDHDGKHRGSRDGLGVRGGIHRVGLSDADLDHVDLRGRERHRDDAAELRRRAGNRP